MEETDLIIIGAGPTGLFATFCAGLRDIKCITLEALGTYGGQITQLYPQKTVYDLQGIPRINATQLAKQMFEQAEMFKSKIAFNSKVTDIIPKDDKSFEIEVNGQTAYKCKSILICEGVGNFEPNKIGIEGEDTYTGKGVYYSVRNPDEFKDKRVLIVGGGDSAFDYAMQLFEVAQSISIVQHNETLKAVEEDVETVKRNQKCKIILNNNIIKVSGDQNSVKQVTIKDNKTGQETPMDTDAVIVAIGYKVHPEVIKSVKFDTSGRYIKVDNDYKTNIDGIYAAGDIANVKDEPKYALLAVGGAEAYMAINSIKKYLSPKASLFGGHSSSLNL